MLGWEGVRNSIPPRILEFGNNEMWINVGDRKVEIKISPVFLLQGWLDLEDIAY